MSLRWHAFLCGFGSDVLFKIDHLRSISFFCQNAHHDWLTKEYISNWFLVTFFLSYQIQYRGVFHSFRKLYHANGLLKICIINQEYELKRVPYKRKLIDLYVFQKSPYSMLLFWRYSKICNSTPIQIGQFIHLTSLFYRQWTKCIVFMLMPKCNQACNTIHVTWREDKGSYLM